MSLKEGGRKLGCHLGKKGVKDSCIYLNSKTETHGYAFYLHLYLRFRRSNSQWE